MGVNGTDTASARSTQTKGWEQHNTCAPKPSYKTGRGHARWSIQGRRHNATRARAREQHERKGGGAWEQHNNQHDRAGEGERVCVYEAELQDRKRAHARINTGPTGDTTLCKCKRMSRQQEGGAWRKQRSNQRERAGEGRRKYDCVHKARATKRHARVQINSRRQQTICPMGANSSTKHDNQQR